MPGDVDNPSEGQHLTSAAWYEWLLHHRHGDDPEYGRAVARNMEAYTNKVLDGARLNQGMTLVDAGAGEGLLSFRAIDGMGTTLHVILTDVSSPLLRHAEVAARRLGVHAQCTFLHCDATRLSGITDESVDVVCLRKGRSSKHRGGTGFTADRPAYLTACRPLNMARSGA